MEILMREGKGELIGVENREKRVRKERKEVG